MRRRRLSRMRRSLRFLLGAFVCLSFLNPVLGAGPEQPGKVLLKHTEPHSFAVMRHQGPYTDLPQVIDSLYRAIAEGGYGQAGPIMAAFFNDPSMTPDAELLWEVRIPVANPGPMTPVGNDTLGFEYADPMYVAYLYHIGPFDEISGTYVRIFDWLARNNYRIAGPPIEVYWSDPANVPEGGAVTELQVPLLEKKAPEAAK
jgi:effector-binding domain-containing protein